MREASAVVQWTAKVFLQEHLSPSHLDKAGYLKVFLQEHLSQVLSVPAGTLIHEGDFALALGSFNLGE
jgi:hypothetical protein